MFHIKTPKLSSYQAQFFTTVVRLSELPNDSFPEIAFVGKSNVGKSTIINTLCQKKKLAFTSKTPGKTQYINFFSILSEKTIILRLVDLPGYGYAKVDINKKKFWKNFISQYLQNRSQLIGIILAIDSRFGITNLDQQVIEWFSVTQKPIYILLNKSDKINFSQKIKLLNQTKQQLINMKIKKKFDIQLFSNKEKNQLDETNTILFSWLNFKKSI